MHRKSIDVWVGLFVLLGAVSLLFLALKAGNMSTISFSKTYAIVGKFDNIGGLKPQSPAKSAGGVLGRGGESTFDLASPSFEYCAVVLDPGYQTSAYMSSSLSAVTESRMNGIV